MADIFSTLVANLNAMGFYGFVLPFLLVFAIVYALLDRSKVLGDKPGPIGIVSLVIGFFVTAFTGIGPWLITLFGISTMYWAALLVVIIFFAMFGFTTSGIGFLTNKWFVAIIIILALIVVSVMGGASIVPGVQLTDDAMAALFMLVVIGLAVYYVTCGIPCPGSRPTGGSDK